MTSWTEEATLRIGRTIKAARGQARSAQWLADRTAELGNPLSRTAISEYETGRRKSMPVTDLLVLAAALDVPPATLMYPDLPDGEVEVLPGVERSSVDAVQWFSGEDELKASAEPEARERVQDSRRLKHLRLELKDAEWTARWMRPGGKLEQGGVPRPVTDEDMDLAKLVLAKVKTEHDGLVAEMRRRGWTVNG